MVTASESRATSSGRLRVGDAEPVRLLVREAPRPGQDPHAERPGPDRDLPPDLSQPHDAERPPVEPARLGVLALVPLALPEVGHLVGDPAVAGEQQPHHQLGHRDRVLARDSWRRRSPRLDAVATSMVSIPAPARITSVSAVPALSASAVTFLPRTIRMCGSASLIARGQLLGLDVRLRHHGAAELLEPVDADLLELVGDQNLHRHSNREMRVISLS